MKHSLKLALKLPSNKGKTNEFLETFSKFSLKAIQIKVEIMNSSKHSLKLASQLPSDKGNNTEFLETFARISVKATLRLRQDQ